MCILKFRVVALLSVLFVIFVAQPLLAAENLADLINKAGMQRMLSQKIAKAYFYHGNGILTQETNRQLEASRTIFKGNQEVLNANVQDEETRNILSYAADTFTKYNELTGLPYNKENAAQVLDMSDRLLESSQYVVVNLEKLSTSKTDHIVNISGRQRMLAQRISKYYIAYQSGFKNEENVKRLQKAVDEFDAALKELMAESRNTDKINELLAKTQEQWKKVSPFFHEVREGGLPIMVLTATDEITNLANKITGLYVETVPAN